MSVSLLCFFSKIHIHKLFYRKIISVVSSCALGIYFVHLHPLVKKYVLVGFFDGFDYSSTLRFITTYVVSIFIIFICGFIIDFIRKEIFFILKIRNFCALFDNIADKVKIKQ